MKGTKREYSNARTPQQNRVAEGKNRTLIEAAQTMLADSLLPITFWSEAVNTAYYVLNRALVTKSHNKTPYELLSGKIPRLDFMRPFGYPVTILNTLDPLGKFKGKADEGFLVGYSVTSKAFRVFNTKTKKVKENLHVRFLENKANVAGTGPNWIFDIDSLTNSMNYIPASTGNQTDKNAGPQDSNGNADNKAVDDKSKDDTGSKTVEYPVNKDDQAYRDKLDRLLSEEKEASDTSNALRKNTSGTFSASGPSSPPPNAFILAHTLLHEIQSQQYKQGEWQRRVLEHMLLYATFTSKEGPITKIKRTVYFPASSHRWNLKRKKAIRTKWVYMNKKDKRGILVRNKARLVAQGYKQEEGIDYDEVLAYVARIEAIRIFLAFASFMGVIVYQMDVKSAFLYGTIEEEVYVSKPPSFIDLHFPNKLYKVENALYGLHQAPRAWYLKGQPKLGLWYPRDSPFDLAAYSDSDYARANLDRKSITGGCQYLGRRIISWQCKKPTIVATSTIEVEYVAAANCCGGFCRFKIRC
uniref:Retrovirus-related Pol polyprotein from transposon TNT 1-94 n=1 Tax=Tanacetum cinerariifolium TaxID=118510 RepID=A0A6L2KE21_TANCI|nr:retrovirus-related Pol polyprotein from transposon TNT 1-94 [Tanacetum cinerariifolium]